MDLLLKDWQKVTKTGVIARNGSGNWRPLLEGNKHREKICDLELLGLQKKRCNATTKNVEMGKKKSFESTTGTTKNKI